MAIQTNYQKRTKVFNDVSFWLPIFDKFNLPLPRYINSIKNGEWIEEFIKIKNLMDVVENVMATERDVVLEIVDDVYAHYKIESFLKDNNIILSDWTNDNAYRFGHQNNITLYIEGISVRKSP